MKHCLIVDDSAVIRKVARRILETLSFRISEAEDGEQALTLCRAEMPDAVLLDWNMPIMDGYEFLRSCAGCRPATGRKWSSAPPRTMSATSRARMHAGADEYIMKPFDKEIVTAKFQEVGLA